VEAFEAGGQVALGAGLRRERARDRVRVAGARLAASQRADDDVDQVVVGEGQLLLGPEVHEQRLDRHVGGAEVVEGKVEVPEY
jgi:hypothetical protein